MQSFSEQKNANHNRNSYYLEKAVDFTLNINEAELTAPLIVESYFSQLSYNEAKRETFEEFGKYLELKRKEEKDFVCALRKRLLEILSFENTEEGYIHDNRKLGKDNYDRIYNTLIHLAKAWPINKIDPEEKKPECPISTAPLDKDNAVTLSIGYRFDINNWNDPNFDGKNPFTRQPFSARDQNRIRKRAAEKGFVVEVIENHQAKLLFTSRVFLTYVILIAAPLLIAGAATGIFLLAIIGGLFTTVPLFLNGIATVGMNGGVKPTVFSYILCANFLVASVVTSVAMFTLGMTFASGGTFLLILGGAAIALALVGLIHNHLQKKTIFPAPQLPANENENAPNEEDVNLQQEPHVTPSLTAKSEYGNKNEIKEEKQAEADLRTPLLNSESKNESNYENKITFFAEKIKKYDPQTLNTIKTILEEQSQLFSSEKPNEAIKNLFDNLIDITNNPCLFKEKSFKRCLGVLISTLNTHEDKNKYEDCLNFLREMQKGNLLTDNKNSKKHASIPYSRF